MVVCTKHSRKRFIIREKNSKLIRVTYKIILSNSTEEEENER